MVSEIAEQIRGINVVIGAETTALSAALADVNQASRGIQGELKQVERLLRLDPSNTELLAQRQTLLGNAIENSAEKLNRLRAAQEQVNQQFARGEISEAQYRAFQREVAASEQALRRFEDRLRESQQETNRLAETLQKTGEKMKGIGEKMSVGITAPIVAAGGLLLKGAVDAENATGKLQAQLGITAEEAADLGAVAQAVWVNGFGENLEEVNNAIKDVRLNMGILAEDELDAVTQGAMTIADVFDQDVKEVTAAAGVAMKNFGIDGQEALDLITVGFHKGGDFSGELLDSFREYSPQFASMGISADKAMGILIAGAQAGAWNLDKVGDAMKEFNIRAQDGSKGTAEGFSAIGLKADEMGKAIASGGEEAQNAFFATVAALAAMKDPVEQNAAGVALFGTQWEDVRSKVITAMAEGVKGVGDFKGATEEAAKAIYDKNPGLALTMAMREVQVAIGPALLPLVDIIKNTVVPAIQDLANGFKNLSPEGQKVALAIAGVLAVIGPLLVILGPIIAIIGSAVTALGAISAAVAGGATGIAILTAAFPVLGTAIAVITGPIGIAIAAIAGLIAVGVLLYNNWGTIMAKGSELLGAIEGVFVGIGQAAENTINNAVSWGQNIIQGLIDGITSKIAAVRDAVSSITSGIKRWFTGDMEMRSPSKTMDQFGQYIAEGLARGIDKGQDDVRKAIENLASIIKSSASTMLADLDRTLQLNNATFSLQADAPGANKSSIKLAELQAQAESTRQKIEILTIALEKARVELGENNNVTKDFSHQLAMSQIELRKTEQTANNLSAAIGKEATAATKELQKSFYDLSEEITAVETKIRDDLASALKEYEQQVADTNTKLAADEQQLTQEYKNNLQQRADALANFVGLFDAVAPKDVSGDQLLDNLRGQVDAFDDWQQNIADLAERGVDEGLIEELRQMGPKAGPEIAALNTLTDDQLKEYVSLWKQKSEDARTEATAQLEQQRAETQQKIQELRTQAAEQLEAYRVEWQKKTEAIRKNAVDEISKIEDRYKDVAENSTKHGVSLMANFIAGIESQFDALRSTLESMATMVDSYMPHSPAKRGPLSKIMEWGPSLVDSLVEGIRSSLPKLEGVMESIATLPSPRVLAGSGAATYDYRNSGNTFQIYVQGSAGDQADQLLRELQKRGVKF